MSIGRSQGGGNRQSARFYRSARRVGDGAARAAFGADFAE
jgi:hypothetical protein